MNVVKHKIKLQTKIMNFEIFRVPVENHEYFILPQQKHRIFEGYFTISGKKFDRHFYNFSFLFQTIPEHENLYVV